MNTTELTTAARKLSKALGEAALSKIGAATGFMQRRRKVLASRLATSLICTLATQKVEWIADLLRGFNALNGEAVQYKPFHNQLAKPAFPRFMEAVFEWMLDQLLVTTLKPAAGSALAHFTEVHIQDGTSFATMASLAKVFPGRFRAISPAAIEVHTTMSLFADNPVKVSVAPDSQGERDFLPTPDELEGKLLLADRGYCGIEYGHAVAKAGGSFIIRQKKGGNPTVTEGWVDGMAERRLAGKKLKDIVGKLWGTSADLSVEWMRNRQPIRFRLLLLWNPTRKQHTLLLTNLARDDFSAETVGTLYRLRWQVELIFKDYKSYANLHGFCTGKAPIAEGLVWASLCAALLKRFLSHTAQRVFPNAQASTRRAAAALAHHLPKLVADLIGRRRLVRPLHALLTFLNENAQRAHPLRDRESGRLSAGLVPVNASSPSG